LYMGLEPGVAEEAAILTAIGIGTAFAVLVVLLAMTLLIRWISVRVERRTAEPTDDAPAQPTQEQSQARNRALAAALAVTALLAARGSSGERGRAG